VSELAFLDRRSQQDRRQAPLPLGLGPSRFQPCAASQAESVLGPALLDAVLQVVRGELNARLTPANAPQRSPWMTPPAASRLTLVPVKTIRAWVRGGRITKRLRNVSGDPKQLKYLINVDDVVAAAQATPSGPAAGTSTDIRERAQQILAAR
jgi:hypothetical protein